MTDVIDFEKFLDRRKRGQGLRRWLQRFGRDLDISTRIKDLPDELLLILAEGGEEGNSLLDNLIMNVWGTDENDVLHLDPPLRMQLLDLSLFLIDQLRFECMARLGWINFQSAREIPLVELIQLGDAERKGLCNTPSLNEEHPHHHRFQAMLHLERETFVRQQIPMALEQFRRQVRRGR
jgi:hypothetical protein